MTGQTIKSDTPKLLWSLLPPNTLSEDILLEVQPLNAIKMFGDYRGEYVPSRWQRVKAWWHYDVAQRVKLAWRVLRTGECGCEW